MVTAAQNERDDESTALRQLALVDRIIGLEAEVAHLRSLSITKEVRAQVRQIKASATWKIGRAVTSPLLLVRRIAKPRKRE
jgi:hypothetical protein